jgi:hypothetical protein
MSVLAPSYGGEMNMDDLGLRKTYSVTAAGLQAPTYNDSMVEVGTVSSFLLYTSLTPNAVPGPTSSRPLVHSRPPRVRPHPPRGQLELARAPYDRADYDPVLVGLWPERGGLRRAPRVRPVPGRAGREPAQREGRGRREDAAVYECGGEREAVAAQCEGHKILLNQPDDHDDIRTFQY